MTGAALLGYGVEAAALGYAGITDWRLRRFAQPEPARRNFAPAVTLLKPLCGLEPELYENLRSFSGPTIRALRSCLVATSRILYNIKKGMRIEFARRFTADCHKLGITIHGTFIIGPPGETLETIEETIRLASDIDPHTIQVSLAPLSAHLSLPAGARERLAGR
jgi:hypothetical protein